MTESDQAILHRISQFSFDEDGTVLTFARRLERENGWTPQFTARVIEEYRRFMFLAVCAGQPVSPSDAVDQVWHLHLTRTVSYWDQFCGQTLGRPVHHTPSRGGLDEADKHHRWYEATLERYRTLLGSEPPPDIWPSASIRFGEDPHYQRISTRKNWVIAKPRISRRVRRGSLVMLLTTAVLGSAVWIGGVITGPGQMAASAQGSGQWSGEPRVETGQEQFAGQDEPREAASFPWVWAVIIAAVVAVAFLFANKCPACDKYRALYKTGAEGMSANGRTKQEKWRCKFCGYDEWKDQSTCGGGCCG